MKVLLLTQVLPYPPDSGPRVKTYHVLRYLAERHEVTLVSFVRGDVTEAAEHLGHYCKDVLTVPIRRTAAQDLRALIKSMLSGDPFMMVRDRRREMLQVLSEVSSRHDFDIVHADQINMAQYAQQISGAKSVLDAHNALWLVYRRLSQSGRLSVKRLLFEREWRLLRVYEGRMGAEFDSVLAVSEEDRHALLEVGVPAEKVRVIPISIDTSQTRVIERNQDAKNILHLGTMFWPPNSEGVSWFLAQIWPRIRRENPGVVFDIVGSLPPRNLQIQAKQDPFINLTGYVADPTAFLRRAAVMVVPLRAGGGMRVKILHALAQGIPVVTTSIGCEGICAENGIHLLVADSPAYFAEATTRLLKDRELANRLASNGRTLVENRYDYRHALAQLDNLYAALATNGREHDEMR